MWRLGEGPIMRIIRQIRERVRRIIRRIFPR